MNGRATCWRGRWWRQGWGGADAGAGGTQEGRVAEGGPLGDPWVAPSGPVADVFRTVRDRFGAAVREDDRHTEFIGVG